MVYATVNESSQRDALWQVFSSIPTEALESGIVSATKASWMGRGGYSLEVTSESWRIFWDCGDGSLDNYTSPGVIVAFPTISDSDWEWCEQSVDSGYIVPDFDFDEYLEELQARFEEDLN